MDDELIHMLPRYAESQKIFTTPLYLYFQRRILVDIVFLCSENQISLRLMGNKLASNSPRLARIAPKGGGPNDALSRLRNRGHMVRLEPAFENRARRLVPACFDGGR